MPEKIVYSSPVMYDEIELISFTIPSIYKVNGNRVNLPRPLNQLVNSAVDSLLFIENEVITNKGHLYLSDAFRTYQMQLQAHLDWKSGKKKAYSPPPGSSFHEAGRAMDIDVGSLGISLEKFWEIAKMNGWVPIISEPDPHASECWHFERRDWWEKIVTTYGYETAAKLSIMDIGINCKNEFLVQGHLAIQDKYKGKIDGIIGPMSQKAIKEFKKEHEMPDDITISEEFIKKLKKATIDYWS